MKETIKKILAENAEIPLDELDSTASDGLLTDIGVDSLNIMYVIAVIEQEFGFTFNEEDMVFNNFNTIDKIENMIKKYTKEV
ncbi:MAG TPA: acyl carrier protein [Ruminiclostridium sp.]|nr:acyl carrier protein [Ruminiclostridium sp.]